MRGAWLLMLFENCRGVMIECALANEIGKNAIIAVHPATLESSAWNIDF